MENTRDLICGSLPTGEQAGVEVPARDDALLLLAALELRHC
jgi:hypothetical protein